jgi:hypothetical protein
MFLRRAAANMARKISERCKRTNVPNLASSATLPNIFGMLGTATSKLTVLGLYVFRTQSNYIHIRVPAILQMFCIHHVQDMERFMESVAGSAILPDADHVRSFLCLRHEPREDEIDWRSCYVLSFSSRL